MKKFVLVLTAALLAGCAAGERVVLLGGGARALARAEGAYVLRFSVDGEQVFAPAHKEAGEELGGMFLAAPYFGVNSGGAKHHGYGRNERWRVAKSSKNSVTFVLDKGLGPWAEVSMQNTITAGPGGVFSAELLLKNNGGSAVSAAPGYHPCFYLPAGEHIVSVETAAGEKRTFDLDGPKIPHGSNTAFIDNITLLTTDSRVIEFTKNENLTKFVIWTSGARVARGERYICAEPTYAGPAFDDGEARPGAKAAPLILPPGSTARFSFTFKVSFI